MTEVTQSLVPCERFPLVHLRPMKDLTVFPEAAQAALSTADRFFRFRKGVSFSGYARQRDDFDSPDNNSPTFVVQVWHGQRIHRTMLFPMDYVGVLNVHIPEQGRPGDFFEIDQIHERCKRMERPDLAPACIGYRYGSYLMLKVPALEGWPALETMGS